MVDARGVDEAAWVAREIIAPLNGYAVLADSNYTPVVPVSASWEGDGTSGAAVFGSTPANRPTRLIMVIRYTPNGLPASRSQPPHGCMGG